MPAAFLFLLQMKEIGLSGREEWTSPASLSHLSHPHPSFWLYTVTGCIISFLVVFGESTFSAEEDPRFWFVSSRTESESHLGLWDGRIEM